MMPAPKLKQHSLSDVVRRAQHGDLKVAVAVWLSGKRKRPT